MKEYGGYIELETFHGPEFHENAIALNSGRHCVEYVIRARQIKKLFLPYFLCDSVRSVCSRLGIETEFYHIDDRLLPIFKQKMCEGEYLYLVNYYGQVSNEKIEELKAQHRNILVDNVQAFFQLPVAGVDTLYSCRKFFGVADGAYLYTDAIYDEPIECDYSYDRMHFLLGRYEKQASCFYSEYRNNNKLFGSMSLLYMSELTHNLLRGIDYEMIEKQRTRNFEYLDKRFRVTNRLRLTVPRGGFMYPLYIADGANIRKQLQQKKIYIPTLWPDVFDVCQESTLEYNMAENILPLPIDQRYSLKDMEYIADEVDAAIASWEKA
ncbi:MAG: hypothetical protein LUG45_04825 [Clostridiales bacterium]|nr:hypothetical protein [Clostridiales bacterium]